VGATERNSRRRLGRNVLIEHQETELLSPVQAERLTSGQGGQFFAHAWVKRSFFLLADLLSLVMAHLGAAAVVNAVFHVPEKSLDPARYWLFFVPFFATVLYLFDGYGNVDLRRPERELELGFKAVSFSFLALLAANAIVFRGQVFSRYLIAVWYLFSLLFLLCVRWLVRTFYARLWKRGLARSRAVVIGDPHNVLRYQQLLAVQRHQAYDVVGLISSNKYLDGVSAPDLPVLGSLDHWEEIAHRENARVIVLNLPSSQDAHRTALHVVSKCRELNIDVEVFADMFNIGELDHEFDYFTGCFRLCSKPAWSRTLQRFCKHLIDILSGVLGSLVAILITPVVAVLINLEDPGPIFHRREFVGCDGELRYYLKFRTMVRDADQILENDPNMKVRFLGNYKLREDPRILRVGRFLRKYSIDEFPQFFALLSGQLTLVGPRVIAQAEKSRYGDFLIKRLSVKPGITGYWQVMGRQTTTYNERIEMDMFYIDHWSIWLDLFIIAKTVGKVIWPEGAY
jgi:exopolysaccharide biosynthesis polyprenyl glycosylphosphotransferase